MIVQKGTRRMTGHEPRWAAVVRNFAREVLARHGTPAATLAIAEHGSETFAVGFGTRERGTIAPVSADTAFGIASVTKGITALAIMQLAEAGRLAVADPVTRYLPAYRTSDAEGTRATTIAHFLTHTAGLPPLPSRFFALARAAAGDPFAAARPAWVAERAPLDDADELLAYIAGLDFAPLGPPGSHFSYCNEGFALLGAIIERVSGLPYATYVRERILDPLGMARSTFERDRLPPDTTLATLHAAREVTGQREVVSAPQGSYLPLWYAAGGLNSTARDLLRYLEIYRTGGVSGGARLLSAAGIARMTTAHTPGGLPGTGYGYGLAVVPDYHGATLVQHGGGSKGIAAHVLVAPGRGYAAVALTNLADVAADQLALAPLNLRLGRKVAAPLAAYAEDTYPLAFLRRCCGTYRGGEGQHLAVSLAGERLRVRMGADTLIARPVGEGGFTLSAPSGESYLKFLVEGDAPAWGVRAGSRIVPRAAEDAA